MKTKVKIIFQIVVILFAVMGSIIPSNACWPQPVERRLIVLCPGGGSFVIRCDCGEGPCTASEQGFCDNNQN